MTVCTLVSLTGPVGLEGTLTESSGEVYMTQDNSQGRKAALFVLAHE